MANEFICKKGLIVSGDIDVTGDMTISGTADANNVDMSRIAGSTYSTVQHMQDIFHSTGWSSGGAITSGTVTSVSVATGTGFIRAADSDIATILFFDWPASGTLSVPTDTVRYIGVEYNSGSPQAVTRASYDWDFNMDFPLGLVVNEGDFLHILNATHAVGDHANNMIQRSYETMPLKRDDRTGGLILGETGTRNITLTAGSLWERLERFAVSAITTSGSDTFDRYYRDGGGGWTKEASQTTWNNTQYDDGDGGLATIDPNRHSVQYFYIELDGDLVSLYGQNQYLSLSLAQDDTPPPNVPDRLITHGKLVGRIIFQESDSSASLVESVFDTSFGTTLVTDHGNLAGLDDNDHGAIYYTESEVDTISGAIYTTKSAVGHTHSRGTMTIAPFESDTAVATGDGKVAWTVPAILNGIDLTAAIASIHTQGSSGVTTVMVRRRRSASDADMLSTGVTVDYNEDFAADATISGANDDINTGDRIYVDVDTAATGHLGLSVTLTFS